MSANSNESMKQVKEMLNAKIPRDVISTRDAGFGPKLSYLAGHYVIDRLNQIFGPDKWSYRVEQLNLTYSGMVTMGKGETNYTSYIAHVSLSVTFPDGSTRTDIDVGFGDGSDRSNPGKTHELAAKEAVTDGLKRCAKSLGMSMGLALYDKAQENVADAEEQPKVQVQPIKEVAVNPSNGTILPPAVGYKPRDPKALRSVIISAASALDAKKTITKSAFKEKYVVNKFKVGSLAEVPDTEIVALFNQVKTDFPELQLQ